MLLNSFYKASTRTIQKKKNTDSVTDEHRCKSTQQILANQIHVWKNKTGKAGQLVLDWNSTFDDEQTAVCQNVMLWEIFWPTVLQCSMMLTQNYLHWAQQPRVNAHHAHILLS